MAIRVLLADDHSVVRDGLRAYLQGQRDMSVVGAVATGHDAVTAAKQLRPDVVVMDISMPGLNGIAATREIRKACSSTQVVIFSMHVTRDHVYEALKSGAHAYVVKDSGSDEIIHAVREVHAGRRYLRGKVADMIVDDFLNDAEEGSSPVDVLSLREREVLRLIAEGKSSPEIAELLGISRKTVVTHRRRMMDKLDIHTTADLVKFAIQNGFTEL
jgi:DNA-binding NarL/FixJ family response regulator